MKKVALLTSVLCLVTVGINMTSCTSDDEGEDNPIIVCPVDGTTRAVFEGSQDMVYPFFAEVKKGVKADENFMISPLSLTEVLAMLANGAEGETQSQILDVMNIGTLSAGQASQALNNLNGYLPKADKKTLVAISNSQWIDNDLKVRDSYVRYNESSLGAETFNTDLSAESTMKAINTWCKNSTYGCIEKIFSQPLSEDTKMVLVNALYFKGLWKAQFKKDKTTDEYFTNYDGSKSKVKMMHQSEDHRVCTDEKFDMAEFAYGNGTFCMDVILPHEGVALDDVLKDFDGQKMDECLNAMSSCEVVLSMPRMEIQYRRRLNDDLMALGMKDAFDPTIANFSKMSDDNLFVSSIEQVTSLKVDEEGTVAAVVTYSGMDTAATPSGTVNFIMDRPFAFIIRDKQTGVVLFIGRIVKL